MRFLLRFVVLLGGCVLAHAAVAADPIVTVDTGQVRGDSDDGIDRFMAIPFAAPPVGDLRWRAPQPPAAWHGVRDATKIGPRCPQVDDFSTHAPGPMAEDCLYLNVWAPRGGGKLPVMVWIHGGGYAAGSGTMKLYDGEALARRGVIIVTINYRLGRLGFFAHPSLKAERDAAYPAEPMGLYGIMDEIAALQWVKRNIAAFGGDAGNVTVFGESAGGGSISMLMVSPLAKGLFARAISQSGGGVVTSGDNHIAASTPQRPSAMLLAQAFLHNEGLPPDMDAKGLRALPVKALLKRQMGGMVWPFVDGDIVPEPVAKMFAEGRQHPVPFLLGANSLEGAMGGIGGRTGDDVLDRIAPDVTREQLMALYGDKPDLWIAQQWMGDARALAGAKYQAMNMANATGGTGEARGAPAYLYYMSYVTQRARADYQGVRHGDELPYVFLALKKFESGPVAADYRVSSLMATYWTNFAKTGDPNSPAGEDLPRWAPYRAEDDNWFEIGDTLGEKRGLLAARMEFHIARVRESAGIQ